MAGNTQAEELRRHSSRRAKALQDQQMDWKPDWRLVSEHIDPTRGRFDGRDGKPLKRNRSKIINSKGTEVLRVMAAGMMSHMTPKAAPWFLVTTADKVLAQRSDVRRWLDAVVLEIRDTLASSNFYKAMPIVYTEDGMFGTAPMLVLEDEREVVRFYPLTCGTYAIGLDNQQRVDSLWRRYNRTARQLKERYGEDKLPLAVKNALLGNSDTVFWVQSLIEPNPDARPGIGPLGLQAPQYRPYREVVWIEAGAEGDAGILSIGGHYEAPFVAARWNPVAEDVYSTAPGVDCLGDIQALQYNESLKLRLIEELSDPTLAVPEYVRIRGGTRLRKGGRIYLPDDQVDKAIARPVYTPDARALMQVQAEIQTLEGRIEQAFFYPLFMMLAALGDQTGRTATEIAERREEKAAVLGPTLESITDEVLDPVIIRVFRLLERAGRIPDPPEDMADIPLKIEYTSILAQAAKASGASTIMRSVEFIANVAKMTGDPSVLDKLDADQAVDEFHAAIGGPASMIRDADEAGKIRAARAQQQQLMQMAAMAPALKDGAQAVKTAGEAVPQDGSAAQALAGAIAGGVQ